MDDDVKEFVDDLYSRLADIDKKLDEINDSLTGDKIDFTESAEFESLSNQMWGLILTLPDSQETQAVKACWCNFNAFIKYGK